MSGPTRPPFPTADDVQALVGRLSDAEIWHLCAGTSNGEAMCIVDSGSCVEIDTLAPWVRRDPAFASEFRIDRPRSVRIVVERNGTLALFSKSRTWKLRAIRSVQGRRANRK